MRPAHIEHMDPNLSSKISTPACRGHQALSNDIQFVEIALYSEDSHACSVFSKWSGPFREVMTTNKLKCYV